MIEESVLSCPHCFNKERETLLENVFPASYRCNKCSKTIKIDTGDCCIYCTFGDYPCIQSQIEGSSCCARD